MNVHTITVKLLPGREAGASNAEQLRTAARQASGQHGVCLQIPEGTWSVADPEAVSRWRKLLDPQFDYKTLQLAVDRPAYSLMLIEDASDITVEATGATLLFEGLIQPLECRRCAGLNLVGLTIDWLVPSNWVARVDAIEGRRVELSFPEVYPVEGGELVHTLLDMHPDEAGKLWHGRRYMPGNDTRLRATGRHSAVVDDLRCAEHLQVGDHVASHVSSRPGSALCLLDCVEVLCQDLTFFAAPGWVISMRQCHNVCYRRVHTIPRPGRPLGPNRDGIHGIENTGLIEVEDCHFESISDDGLNLHNDAYEAHPGTHPRQILMVQRHNMRGGSYDGHRPTFQRGDVLELLSGSTYERYASALVADAQVDGTHLSHGFRIELQHPLPAAFRAGDFACVASRMARLHMRRCVFSNNFAHGIRFALKTGVIEDCLFEHLYGPGIDVNPAFAPIWSESGHVDQLIVRRNTFRRCGRSFRSGDGWGFATRSELPRNAVGLHRNILLEDNHFQSEDPGPAVYLGCARDVIVRGNTFDCPPPYVHTCHTRDASLALPGPQNICLVLGEASSDIVYRKMDTKKEP